METPKRTGVEKKRAAWLAEHFKSEISIGERFQLLDQCRMLFPQTPEERQQKTESLMAMPEFVL
jgi:hypothetical protein